MKSAGLPGRRDLISAYEALQFGPASVHVNDLTAWAAWTRIDARLAELMVRYFARQFKNINPFDLGTSNNETEVPQAVAVLLEFAEIRLKQEGSDYLKSFRSWKNLVLDGLGAAPPQLFFVPSGFPNSKRMNREMSATLKPYSKWGFFSDEWIAKIKTTDVAPPAQTQLAKGVRLRILDELISDRETVTVDDFLEACHGLIHRRTAERDLRASTRLRRKGFTRSLVYLKKSKS